MIMKTIYNTLLLGSLWLLGCLLSPVNTVAQQQPASLLQQLTPLRADSADFTTTITIAQSPDKVYAAINNVRGWWSEEIEGNSSRLNDVFNYHFEDVHRCQLQVVELIPGKKVVWLVKKNYFKFTRDKTEWTGTKIIFELEEKEGKTLLHFTHQGLVPEYECYSACSSGWNQYIGQSLPSLATTGKGQPNGSGKPKTISEQQLRSAAGTK